MPIYPRKWETGWGLDSYLKNCMLRLFFNMPSSSFFLFLQPYEGSKGFEARCPHFQQMMQLHEQRMKLELSMQSNTRQWCLRITQNTIEAHVHPHKCYVHVCACTHKHTHALSKGGGHLPKPLFLIQPKLSNQWDHAQLFAAHYSDWKMLLSAFVCFNWYLYHFKVQTKRFDCVQQVLSLWSEETKAVHCHLVRKRKAD